LDAAELLPLLSFKSCRTTHHRQRFRQDRVCGSARFFKTSN